jgi:hypothetical protein
VARCRWAERFRRLLRLEIPIRKPRGVTLALVASNPVPGGLPKINLMLLESPTLPASPLDKNWLRHVEDDTCDFLERLRVPEVAGRYLPCESGVTPIGREMSLAFSCLALRTLRMFGRWREMPATERHAWADFIKGFQEPNGEGAFRDEPELRYVAQPQPWLARLAASLLGQPGRPSERELLLAEIHHTLGTLEEIGIEPARPFTGFPSTPAAVQEALEALDWRRPAEAGTASAALVFFIATQAPHFLASERVLTLLCVCREFFATLADPETGAYFCGRRPAHAELIEGAMKVLMSLDWLGVEPHHPEQLVATCLERPPPRRVPDVVSTLYVLHQCLPEESSAEVKEYCVAAYERIRGHYHPNGGFSYHVGRAQDRYHGIPITTGGNEPDVQGTCLAVWGLAMIWRLVEPRHVRWGVLRP